MAPVIAEKPNTLELNSLNFRKHRGSFCYIWLVIREGPESRAHIIISFIANYDVPQPYMPFFNQSIFDIGVILGKRFRNQLAFSFKD